MVKDSGSVALQGFQVFERSLVNLIKSKLDDAYGSDWEKKGFPWLLAKLRTRKRADQPLSRAKEPSSILGYAHLGELSEIVVSKTNWRLFKPLFASRERLKRELDVLNEYRPQLAHSGDTVTSIDDARYVLATAKKVLEVYDEQASAQVSALQQELDSAAGTSPPPVVEDGRGGAGKANDRQEQGRALRIIDALRKGTPQREEVDKISVGRERLSEYFREKLTQIKEFGLSDVKFISADFGHGKTHFLYLVRQIAFDLNFVVSHVGLHSTDAPFDQLRIIIQRFVQGMATQEFRNDGLTRILDRWAADQAGKTEQDVYESIADVPFAQMREKLVVYSLAHNSPGGIQFGSKNEILRWFRGEETKSKTFTNAKEYLHGIVSFLQVAGYSGLVVMLDEAEAITSLSRVAKRDLANENIRQIIDNDENTEGFYLVFASTPTFFDDARTGAPTYDALWRRIRPLFGKITTQSLESVIVELPALDEDQFVELGRKIHNIYEIAKGRKSPVTDEHLMALASHVWRRADRRVGTMVRVVVAALEDADTPTFDLAAEYPLLVERVIEEEKRDRSA